MVTARCAFTVSISSLDALTLDYSALSPSTDKPALYKRPSVIHRLPNKVLRIVIGRSNPQPGRIPTYPAPLLSPARNIPRSSSPPFIPHQSEGDVNTVSERKIPDYSSQMTGVDRKRTLRRVAQTEPALAAAWTFPLGVIGTESKHGSCPLDGGSVVT